MVGAVAASAARVAARLAAAVALAALLAGVPAGLAFAVGWPLPTSLPAGWAGWQQLLSSPIPDTAILRLLAVAGWLLWAAFTRAVWVEARAAWHGVRAPDRRWLGASPLRASAAFLIAALFAGSIAAGTATASRPAAAATTTGPAPAAKPAAAVVVAAPATGGLPAPAADRLARAPLLPAGPALLVVDGCGYLYTVAKGDSLWTIAEHCLGDGTRWPQIWQLNKGKFWPAISGHKRLDDPDLIYPRWTLTLPVDAAPPAGAPPTEPATPPGPGPGAPGTPAPTAPASPTPTAPASGEPDGVVAPPATTAPPLSTAPSATVTPSPAPTPAPPSPVASSPDDAPPAGVDEHGVRLPDGSWIPWTLAGAVVAAMAVVWLQRRRRYQPRPLDGTAADKRPADPPPPPVVRAVGRHWRARPAAMPEITASPTDEPPPQPPPPAVAVPPVPAIDPLPAGGLGLVGDGAEAAARGALVAALAAGAPTDPDARTEVVIPADTMITLLGADAVAVGTWPRLRVTPDLDAALAVLEQRLLHAARLLDDHDVDDVATLRRAAPAEQPLPPMLLLAATPPPGLRVRTRMVLGLGSGVQVTALLLGQWGHGPTVRVDPDGSTHPLDAPGGVAGQLPTRMAVLEQAAATDLLATMREAHTGEPAPAPHPEPQLAANAATDPPDTTDASRHPAVGADDEKATAAPAGANDEKATVAPHGADDGIAVAPDELHFATGEPDQAPPAGAPARVRVLGAAHIVDRPVGELFRSDAVELMVYLAVHADGATPEQIKEDLFPAVRRRPAAGRLHTAAHNLRKLLALSVGGDPGDYVVKHRGRYRLHADTVDVDVDLWTLRRAHATARAATGDDRLTALRQACGVYTGELAEGADYEWITRHRKGVADLAIDAHTALAAAIADTDPQQAAQLLQAAADHDPLNEEVCQRAMRAWHRLGDGDAIRALLRRLALALDEIGAEPAQDTIALADQLRRDLQRPHRAA